MMTEPIEIGCNWTWLDYAVAHRDLLPETAATLRTAAALRRPIDVTLDGGAPQRCRIELTDDGFRLIVLRREQ